MSQLGGVKALVFDVIGTTTDWLTPVLQALQTHAAPFPDLGSHNWTEFAQLWRVGFATYVRKQQANPGEYQHIETFEVYRRVLGELCTTKNITQWNADVKEELVKSWGSMTAWEDTATGLSLLKQKFILCALSNGRASWLIDVFRCCGMTWDLILSSDIIGAYKPDPKMYLTAASVLNLPPEQIAMVAAHTYDLKAAAKHGFKTIYIARETEDFGQPVARNEVDLFIERGGLVELAKQLGATV